MFRMPKINPDFDLMVKYEPSAFPSTGVAIEASLKSSQTRDGEPKIGEVA
jgi:hypothetical protein